jgi:hypothetical protein
MRVQADFYTKQALQNTSSFLPMFFADLIESSINRRNASSEKDITEAKLHVLKHYGPSEKFIWLSAESGNINGTQGFNEDQFARIYVPFC